MGAGRRIAVTSISLLAVLGLGAGYVAANARDLVPGPFTTADPWPSASPFPSVTAPPAAAAPQVLPAVSTTAPLPTAEGIAAALESLRTAPEVGAPPGVLVVDVVTGETITGADGDAAFVPASTTKMLTAAAVSATLDLNETLPTTAQLVGADELYLVGSGDMAMAAGAGDPTLVRGRAGVADLADRTVAALQARGLTSVTLRLDDSAIVSDGLARGWEQGLIWNGYVTPVEALAIDLGVVQGRPQNDTEPATTVALTFAQALRDRGIEVREGPSRAELPAGAVELARVESATIGELLDYAMAESHNTLTELLGRLVAIKAGQPATFDGAVTAILASVANLGIDVQGTVLADASGLSPENRITPRLLTSLLVAAHDEPLLRSFARALPVSGLEGTLADRWLEDGMIRAKTGTLPSVVSLAGYVPTADGRLLAFAVMANGVPVAGSYQARIEVDGFVEALRGCGCR